MSPSWWAYRKHVYLSHYRLAVTRSLYCTITQEIRSVTSAAYSNSFVSVNCFGSANKT